MINSLSSYLDYNFLSHQTVKVLISNWIINNFKLNELNINIKLFKSKISKSESLNYF